SACSTDVGQAGKSGALQLQSAEAEDAAVLGSAFVVREEEGASGGKVLVQPTGVRPSSEAAEDATVAFTVPVDGQYVLWARLKGASEQQNAVYLGFDGELERVEVFRYGEWVWVAVASTQLSAGEHVRSEEHTSELQSRENLVCRLLLDPAPAQIYTLSLHDALPICRLHRPRRRPVRALGAPQGRLGAAERGLPGLRRRARARRGVPLRRVGVGRRRVDPAQRRRARGLARRRGAGDQRRRPRRLEPPRPPPGGPRGLPHGRHRAARPGAERAAGRRAGPRPGPRRGA